MTIFSKKKIISQKSSSNSGGGGNETAATIAAINHGTSAKTTLVDADEVTGQDSENSFSLIRTTWLNAWVYISSKITYTFFGSFLHAASNKTTPVDADEVGIWDSVSGLFQRVSFTNIKAFLKTYFDAVYQTKYTDVSDNQIITGTSITLPNTPIFIYGVFMNGQRLTITTDYTISGVTITLVNAASSDLFTTVYKY